MKSVLFIFFFVAFTAKVTSQDSTVAMLLHKKVNHLSEYFEAIAICEDDDQKLAYNDQIISVFNEILSIQETYDFPFDTLKRMGIITSPDQTIKIYNWNIPFRDHTTKYFGYIQKKPRKDGKCTFYYLNDNSSQITDAENAILSHKNWFGVLYYKIVPVKINRQIHYTLLGYDLNDAFTQKKLVDVLYFNEEGYPVFGRQIFEKENKKEMVNRLFFEYSTKAVMNLTYDENMELIVFDHLSPAKPIYKDNFQYYGPDMTYDALRFEKGQWKYISNIIPSHFK